MSTKGRIAFNYFLLALLFVMILGAVKYEWNFALLVQTAKVNPYEAAYFYVASLAASIVLLPLSSLILLPFAAETWGIFIGGTLSALGWWLGSLFAFVLARHIGRPLLRWFVSLEQLDQWEEILPRDVTFLSIVLIRMIAPVDIPSFALGLLKHLPFTTYAFASLIGIVPFAYFMVAMGGAVATGQWLLFFLLMSFVATNVFILHRVWKNNA
jgi:uncharacterized membrane protein YdjX (TVP38/TMEM64 family)